MLATSRLVNFPFRKPNKISSQNAFHIFQFVKLLNLNKTQVTNLKGFLRNATFKYGFLLGLRSEKFTKWELATVPTAFKTFFSFLICPPNMTPIFKIHLLTLDIRDRVTKNDNFI